MACAETSLTVTCLGGAAKLAPRWPEVIDATRRGERSPAALISTLRALIHSGPARPDMVTCPDGWRSAMPECSGTTSRRRPVHGLCAAHR